MSVRFRSIWAKLSEQSGAKHVLNVRKVPQVPNVRKHCSGPTQTSGAASGRQLSLLLLVSSAEAGQVSALETGQMSAAVTGLLSVELLRQESQDRC